MQNTNSSTDKMHRMHHGNAVAMNEPASGHLENGMESSKHERLYQAATVAAVLLLLAGAAAA